MKKHLTTWYNNVVQSAHGVSVPCAGYDLGLGAEGEGVDDTRADLVLDAAVAVLSPNADSHTRKNL